MKFVISLSSLNYSFPMGLGKENVEEVHKMLTDRRSVLETAYQ